MAGVVVLIAAANAAIIVALRARRRKKKLAARAAARRGGDGGPGASIAENPLRSGLAPGDSSRRMLAPSPLSWASGSASTSASASPTHAAGGPRATAIGDDAASMSALQLARNDGSARNAFPVVRVTAAAPTRTQPDGDGGGGSGGGGGGAPPSLRGAASAKSLRYLSAAAEQHASAGAAVLDSAAYGLAVTPVRSDVAGDLEQRRAAAAARQQHGGDASAAEEER